MMARAVPKSSSSPKTPKSGRKSPTKGTADTAVLDSPPATPRGPGRPRKAKEPVVLPEPLGGDLLVKAIPLTEVDLDDLSYRFRAVVRVPELIKSVQERGQQIPAVVRPHPNPHGEVKYQLISGFRRATALTVIGFPTIFAYIRKDLENDEEAFKASVLENMARKTYSDIDRAYIIQRHREAGHRTFEIEELMNLSVRQHTNLLSLLELPEVVQAAIASEVGTFKTTHALILRKLKGKYKVLDYAEWVKKVNDEELSVTHLTRRVNETYRSRGDRALPSIFRADGTNLAAGQIRLRPVKFDVATLSADDRQRLKDELAALMQRL